MIAVDRTVCELCGTCVGVCPADALAIELNALVIDHGTCTGCLSCVAVCPVEAITNRDED